MALTFKIRTKKNDRKCGVAGWRFGHINHFLTEYTRFGHSPLVLLRKEHILMEKVTNIEYGNVDFKNDIIEFLTSTPI